jgi:fructose-1,6-bisphosphatase/sedoheptulose 1,7-bisphosphatase-like protein
VHARLTVAADVRPTTVALVRVDSVDAAAAVVACSVQAVVYVLLAVGACEAGFATAEVVRSVGRRRRVEVVFVVYDNAVAESVGLARARVARRSGQLLALTACEARGAVAYAC